MTKPIITRAIEVSHKAVRAGILTLPEGVTYLRLSPNYDLPGIGEFPACTFLPDVCPATLRVGILGDPNRPPFDLTCTRDHEHDRSLNEARLDVEDDEGADLDLHVCHLVPGIPVAAWTGDPA